MTPKTPTAAELAEEIKRLADRLADGPYAEHHFRGHRIALHDVIDKLASLSSAQQIGEAVAYVNSEGFIVEKDLPISPGTLLYARPQQVALTDEQIEKVACTVRPIVETGHPSWEHAVARAIEKAHGIGGAR